MKLLAVGVLAVSTMVTPRVSDKVDPQAAQSSIQVIATKVQSPVSQWENYQARMVSASQELETIVEDVQQMNPDGALQVEPILEELVGRHDELAEIVNLGSEGLREGLIDAKTEFKDLQNVVEPEISAFEDAVFRLRDALDQHLNLRVEI